MIQVELSSIKRFAAILAGILISLEDIVACEFNLFLGKSIKDNKKNDPGNSDAERNGSDKIVIILPGAERTPLRKIKGLKGAPRIFVDHLSSPFEEKRERTSCSAHVDRLPEPIQNQHRALE